MKLQALAICCICAALPAYGEGGKNQEQHQKRFGDGTCLPQYLNQYDVDGNGAIDTEEAQVMKQARDQIRKQLRTDWDADGDGQISDQERDRARTQLREMIEETRIARFWEAESDDDGDETLSYAEFVVLPGIAKKLEDGNDELVLAIFDRLDADDDGQISLDEFLEAVRECDRLRDGSGEACPNPR